MLVEERNGLDKCRICWLRREMGWIRTGYVG